MCVCVCVCVCVWCVCVCECACEHELLNNTIVYITTSDNDDNFITNTHKKKQLSCASETIPFTATIYTYSVSNSSPACLSAPVCFSECDSLTVRQCVIVFLFLCLQ